MCKLYLVWLLVNPSLLTLCTPFTTTSLCAAPCEPLPAQVNLLHRPPHQCPHLRAPPWAGVSWASLQPCSCAGHASSSQLCSCSRHASGMQPATCSRPCLEQRTLDMTPGSCSWHAPTHDFRYAPTHDFRHAPALDFRYAPAHDSWYAPAHDLWYASPCTLLKVCLFLAAPEIIGRSWAVALCLTAA